MLIRINDLVKSYSTGENSFLAVNHTSFDINEGEICVILGPSGSGKSTLMNIIGGLESADSGSIQVSGKEIINLSSTTLSQYRRQYIGFVFQFYNLIPNLTVKENIELCAHLGEHPLDIDMLLEKVGLTDQAYKFPSALSGGQQQRVAIARALVKNPKILLCDEPTGALDYKTSKEVLSLFAEINAQYGTTIIMITHNDAIRLMAHRVIKLKDGKVIQNNLNEKRLSVEDIEW